MISENEISKLEISPRYLFHSKCFDETFIIDFENRTVRWKNDNSMTGTSHIKYDPNDELYTKIVRSYSGYDYYVEDEKFTQFKNRLIEMNFMQQLYEMDYCLLKDFDFSNDNLKESMIDILEDIELAKSCKIKVYTKSEERSFVINFDIPEMYTDFANAVNQLVDSQVLNVEDEDHFVNTLNYEFRKDGIYDISTDEKLEPKSFSFEFKHANNRKYSFSIDFETFEDHLLDLIDNDKIIFNSDLDELRNHDNYELIIQNDNQNDRRKITVEQVNKFLKALKNNYVYMWGDKHSWNRTIYYKTLDTNAGYDWSVELEFTNDAVYHIGFHDVHPDSYHSLGKDLKQIFGIDLLRLDDCVGLD